MDRPMATRDAAAQTAHVVPCAYPWEVSATAPSEDYETVSEAARRLGKHYGWMSRRAVRLGLIAPQPVGRPRKGQEVRLPASHWDVAAAPTPRTFVSLGSLEKETNVDYRTILTRCNDLGLKVYVDHPKQRAKHCVSATEAKTVMASLAADKNRKALKTTAEAMGVHRDKLKRILERNGLLTLRSVRRRLLVDPVAAREALLKDLATETLDASSKRTGIEKNQLRQWLREDGLLPLVANRRKSWLEPSAVDAVVAHRKGLGLETLRQASARTGVAMSTLRRALISAGVVMIGKGRQRPWIEPAVVNDALQRHKEKLAERQANAR